MLSHVRLFAIPCTVAHQAPLSMEVSRQEFLSGLPFPSPVDLSDLGVDPGSPALQETLYCLSHQGSPILRMRDSQMYSILFFGKVALSTAWNAFPVMALPLTEFSFHFEEVPFFTSNLKGCLQPFSYSFFPSNSFSII